MKRIQLQVLLLAAFMFQAGFAHAQSTCVTSWEGMQKIEEARSGSGDLSGDVKVDYYGKPYYFSPVLEQIRETVPLSKLTDPSVPSGRGLTYQEISRRYGELEARFLKLFGSPPAEKISFLAQAQALESSLIELRQLIEGQLSELQETRFEPAVEALTDLRLGLVALEVELKRLQQQVLQGSAPGIPLRVLLYFPEVSSSRLIQTYSLLSRAESLLKGFSFPAHGFIAVRSQGGSDFDRADGIRVAGERLKSDDYFHRVVLHELGHAILSRNLKGFAFHKNLYVSTLPHREHHYLFYDYLRYSLEEPFSDLLDCATQKDGEAMAKNLLQPDRRDPILPTDPDYLLRKNDGSVTAELYKSVDYRIWSDTHHLFSIARASIWLNYLQGASETRTNAVFLAFRDSISEMIVNPDIIRIIPNVRRYSGDMLKDAIWLNNELMVVFEKNLSKYPN